MPPLPLPTRKRDDGPALQWVSGGMAEIPPLFLLELGARLVDVLPLHSGVRVLDVAAGAGSAAVAAAGRGAQVTATDATRELLAAGERSARMSGVDVNWVHTDAGALPFGDAAFDVVLSSAGVMFEPDHRRAAEELARVCRPGGLIALLSWTPAGMLGALGTLTSRFAAPPKVVSAAPAAWGDPEHLAGLFGDAVDFGHTELDTLRVSAFANPKDLADLLAAHHGPTIAARTRAEGAGMADDFDVALDDFCAEWDRGGWFELEFLVAVGSRA